MATESTAIQVSSWVTLQHALQTDRAEVSGPLSLTQARTTVASAVGKAANFLKQRRMTTEVSRSGGLVWHANSACAFTQLPDTVVLMVIAFVDVEYDVQGLACAGVAFGWPQPSQENKTLASFASPTIIGPVKVKGAWGSLASSVNGVYIWMDSVKLGGPGLRNVLDPDIDFRKKNYVSSDPTSSYWQVTWPEKFLLAINGRVRDPAVMEWHMSWEYTNYSDVEDDDDESRCVEVFRHVPPVIVTGATGPNAENINGIYLPTNENVCGIERLQKDDQSDSYLQFSGNEFSTYDPKTKKLMEMVPGGYKWVISCQSDAVAGSRSSLDDCWAYCLQTRLSDPVKAKTWHVNGCGVQPSMKVDRWVAPFPPSFTLQVTGAKGLFSHAINGTYVPTGELYNGKMLFKKSTQEPISSEGDTWLRFAAAGGQNVWMISRNTEKEENRSGASTPATSFATPCHCFCNDRDLADPSEASMWNEICYDEEDSKWDFSHSPEIEVKRAAL
jgi:hypothetical protein